MEKLKKFLRNYVNGDDAEIEYFVPWPVFVAIVLALALIIYLIWRK